MTSKLGREYEDFVGEIYEALNSSEGLSTVKIQRDIRLRGSSGFLHQIDVYWEVEIDGRQYRIAVECKDYGRKVSVGRTRDFFGVLYDIGKIGGILCTKIGFSRGSKVFAEYYGISLQEVRIPDQTDWNGRAKQIVVNLTGYTTSVTSCRVIPDWGWLLTAHGSAKGDHLNFSPISGLENEIAIYDASGRKVTDFLQLKQRLPSTFVEQSGLIHSERFDDGYMDTAEWGRIKINEIEFVYTVGSVLMEGSIDGEKLVKGIIKDVQTGKMRLIDVNGHVRDLL